jgi:hypothetical protein
MAKYDNDKPYPVTGGKTIPDLKIDIEEYIVDNTQGFVTAPITHNMLKNVINSIPLGGSTKFNINNLSDWDILVRVGNDPETAKWENTQNYTYHSSGTRTEVYSVDEVYHKDLLYTSGQTYTKTEIDDEFLKYYNSGDTYSKLEIDSILEDVDVIILNSGNTNINSPSTGSISINGISRTYYDSIFWDGTEWVNKPAFDTDSISEIIDNILEDGLPTISGYTVEEYIRSQFEADVHVNQSGQTEYPNSNDGVGNLILWTDGIYGVDWQPSVIWRGQYGTTPTQSSITHMEIKFDENSGDGEGDFILNLNGEEALKITKENKIVNYKNSFIFNESNSIEEYETLAGKKVLNYFIFGHENEISSKPYGGSSDENSVYDVIIGGRTNKIHNSSNSSIIGGQTNKISGITDHINYSSIIGGRNGEINGSHSSIIGGLNGEINGSYSSIIGGFGNEIKSDISVTLGGQNLIVNDQSCVALGEYNLSSSGASDDSLFVVGNGSSTDRKDAFVIRKDDFLEYKNEKKKISSKTVFGNDNLDLSGEYFQTINLDNSVIPTNWNLNLTNITTTHTSENIFKLVDEYDSVGVNFVGVDEWLGSDFPTDSIDGGKTYLVKFLTVDGYVYGEWWEVAN